MIEEKITIELPESLIPVFSKKYNSPGKRVKELAILELYREGEISSGKASELLNMERFEFIQYASRLGIPFLEMSKEELYKDLENSKAVSGR